MEYVHWHTLNENLLLNQYSVPHFYVKFGLLREYHHTFSLINTVYNL